MDGQSVQMMQNNLQRFNSLKEAVLCFYGSNAEIIRTDRVFGGDINEAYRLTLQDGTHIFMKSNKKENVSFFEVEAVGLSAIASTNTIGTPHIICYGTDDDKGGYSFLLMEFIYGKNRIADYWEILGQQLAAMHQANTLDFVNQGKFGFIHDNYIGARSQKNTANDSWIAFFRDCRLIPQFHRASDYFESADKKKINKLLEKLDDILIEPVKPSILHGDLWSGNVISGNDGRAWLIDPAAYVGHAEADIAMTELFGGFPAMFYDAYKEVAHMQEGYSDRRDVYNLYHLLNHLNMFGRTYFSSVKRIIDEYV